MLNNREDGVMRFAGIGEWLLNDGWFFLKLPEGSTKEQASGSAGWKEVQLPHDWLIWQADRLYESADAWYRRELVFSPQDGPSVLLRFDGVYMDCDVLFNGEKVCSHQYGYTAFDADLTGKIKEGRNEILVHIRHRSPNSRWYSGSGIFRDVRLAYLAADHIVPGSLYTVTEQVRDGWEIRAEAEAEGTGEILFRLLDAAGELKAEESAAVRNGKAAVRLFLQGGETWDPERPYLYTLEYSMGEQRERSRLGLRTLRFDPESGFWINGRNLKLKGVCNHHDLGALGSAFHAEAAERQLRIMKKMGVNALRTSHNPPAEILLDLCDEMGILVVDEIFDMWERPKTQFDYARFFTDHEAGDVASWIRRDRNHPCVIMWSIGNEIYDMFADIRGTEITRMLTDQVRFHDPAGHAAVTFGSNYMPWEGAQRCAGIVKIPGYNYAENLYAEHHAAHPDWVIYGSETASVLSSRGIYHFPLSETILSESDLQCSSLGNSVSSWGAQNLAKMIVDDLNNRYSMGQFVWSGFDYIGEPTPYHTRSCYFGQVDTAGFPKDSYYLFRSLWTDEPMVHIGVYWDWNPGQMIDIRVMSNCAETELFLNGNSLGRKQLNRKDPETCTAVWKIPYEPGTLEAVGLDDRGNELCRDIKRSFGDTASLRLSSDKTVLKADGKDLAFITVEALDRDGIPVENARDRVSVRVEGGGALMGLDNGDPSDTDEYKGRSRRLFGGKLLILAGSSGREEPAVVTVSTTEGLTAEIRIDTVPVEEREPFYIQEIPGGREDGEIPVRKVEIIPQGSRCLTPEHPETSFTWKAMPENASPFDLDWQITTGTGIPSPCATFSREGSTIRVRAAGDGQIWLRALYGNAADHHPEQISQIELSVEGFGKAGNDPYRFVSAGLYDLSEGEIGAGNEKGIAFARSSGKSMVGFSGLDFGPDGSDRITMSIFTLDSDAYDIRVYDGEPGRDGRLITVLRYCKPSIWNVYQDETYALPERLRGVHTLCFEADRKFHFRGFRFERQERAYSWQNAGDADEIYGDSFVKDGTAVLNIGNNVSLVWNGLDFGDASEVYLTLEGRTPMDVCAVSVRLENEKGAAAAEMIRFLGGAGEKQTFSVTVPEGRNRVSLVFLPGSRFDLFGFGFSRK